MPTDPLAVAESIIVHAETLCEREDHLWDVIRKLSIPIDNLEDARDQNRVNFGTDEIFRTLLFHMFGRVRLQIEILALTSSPR